MKRLERHEDETEAEFQERLWQQADHEHDRRIDREMEQSFSSVEKPELQD